ncbi:A disintegrin and metalloproteinase with thrombospondin motifs 7 isoform X2 [Octopus bimaculoides]|uniref:A disintegrin and metalloproteinase with thrombospondin motifs 7 isoform X2 n=1 Tax=Octopus bimaculoides TaxID=37653 RepID=UPI0022E6BAB4|nr:A disintegrin and metalloproteinase with thrombospondin motifs 7 isoform X2 [Octopus bimaculoides]
MLYHYHLRYVITTLLLHVSIPTLPNIAKTNCKLACFLLSFSLSLVIIINKQTNDMSLTLRQRLLHILFVITTVHSAVLRDYNLPDTRQGEFLKLIKDYEVTLPYRVNSEGQFETHILHPEHHTVKRSTEPETVHYHVVVENKTLHLQMKLNDKFTSPGMVVERLKSRFKNVSDSTFVPYWKRKCFFSGKIKDHTTSNVALQVCNGLTGHLKSQDGDYFIEPIKGHSVGANGKHPHIVYKRSVLPQFKDISDGASAEKKAEYKSTPCSVGDDENVVKENKESESEYNDRNDDGGSNPDLTIPVKRVRSRRRMKRSISSEKHVETLVVVDPIMMDYYKNEDVETYVLTVMNMVSSLFHDASIGNAINIKIVRLLLLEDEQEGLKITHHADRSLRSFCHWQRKMNFKEDSHPNHHDVAVLLTRHDICSRIDRPCNTLGLAHLSGMCQPQMSCNINEDSGLALAYTIAHELGHNLGMKHDGGRSKCISSSENSYVMAPQMFGSSRLRIWSPCSKKAVTKFFDRDRGYCLNDESTVFDYVFPFLPPGTMYNADHQCRLQYGPEAKVCDSVSNICSYLWCHVNKTCTTKREPAAEGTICGRNKWCFDGECVTIGDRPQSINGEWGEWGEWTKCTTSCGAGVSNRQRYCDNPPPSHGGKYCIGERKRYRICNTEPCPEGSRTFREEQCAKYNNIEYDGQLYQWEPVRMQSSPCQLYCKTRDVKLSVLKADMAADGTRCSLIGRNICINGQCRRVGCDWVLESSAKEDRCGVCHGDGSTCKTIKDQFNETKGSGYQEVKMIPAGARNIFVNELKGAQSAEHNYLALRNQNGEYYLNGGWFIEWSGDYEIAGTIVHYSREGDVESFNAVGPLKEPLTIMLLLQSTNPGVEFEYTVPNENASHRIPEFSWQYTDWSHCTSSCGGGTQRSVVICTEMEAGAVDEMYCNASMKPDDKQRKCNEHLCPAMWWEGPWQHCSVTCGSGVQRRTVMCVRSFGDKEQMALDDSACVGQKKPNHEKECHHTDVLCPKVTRWISSPWDDTCTDNPCGWKKREVVCEDPIIGCNNATKLATSVRCSNMICGHWSVSDWSLCSRSCDGGFHYRDVTCVGMELCDLDLKPSSKKHCNVQECTEMLPPTINKLNSDSQSSSTSSPQPSSPMTTTVPTTAAITTTTTTTPTTTTPTTTMTTTTTTTTTTSSPSSTSTLPPTTTTIKTTSTVRPNLIVPTLTRKTTLGVPRKTIPKTSAKTTVSTTTSSIATSLAVSTRPVTRRSKTKHILSTTPSILKTTLSNANKGKKKEQRPGHRSDVSDKHTDNFVGNDTRKGHKNKTNKIHTEDLPSVPTSRPTKEGSKNKSVTSNVSHDNNKTKDKSPIKNKPPPSRYQWTFRKWTPCDFLHPQQKCGHSNRSRVVYCVDRRSRRSPIVPSYKCNVLIKPPELKACYTPCKEWMTASWSMCSATCGDGMQWRKVKCPQANQCELRKKPQVNRKCNIGTCPSMWITGYWSKCTKTCGTGDQIRLVKCLDIASRQPTEDCDPATKPIIRRKCQIQHCPKKKHRNSFKCGKPENENLNLCRKLRERGRCKHVFVNQICCNTCQGISINSRKRNRIRS